MFKVDKVTVGFNAVLFDFEVVLVPDEEEGDKLPVVESRHKTLEDAKKKASETAKKHACKMKCRVLEKNQLIDDFSVSP